MNAAEFKKIINTHFAPTVRDLGWKGSGFSYYQQNENHVANIFGIQGSWHGGSVRCETAIHFDFIPDLAQRDNIAKTSFASCVIRKRLSPKGEGGFSWNFKDNMEHNLASVNQILTAFLTHGQNFYSDFAKFPQPFDSIKADDLRLADNYLLLGKYFTFKHDLVWLLQKINQFLDRQNEAKEFSELGIYLDNQFAESMLLQNNSKRQQKAISEHLLISKERYKM